MSQQITYSNISSIQQRLDYGAANGYQTTDSNGNTIYYPVCVYTDVKTIGSDGSVRDTQLVTPAGTSQASPFTPQAIYTIVNSAAAGPLLAAQLKAAFDDAIATVVS
jgi:hypothetical protein